MQRESEIPLYWGFRKGQRSGDPCEIFPIFHRVDFQHVRPVKSMQTAECKKIRTAADVKTVLDAYRLEQAEVDMQSRRASMQKDQTALEKMAKRMGM